LLIASLLELETVCSRIAVLNCVSPNSIALSPDGRVLFVAGVVDLDFPVVAYKSLPTTLDGDANADGCVDDADLLLVLFNFGQQCCGIPFDLNGDCVVDDSDLLMVLFNFGSGC